MSTTPTILFVDDEELVLTAVQRLFATEAYTLLTASSAREALEYLEKNEVQVVVSDYRMPGMSGGELLQAVADRWPDTIRIILSGYADISSVITAINEGQIYKFISKPWQNEELKNIVRAAADKHHQLAELRALAEDALAQNESLISTHLENVRSTSQRNYHLEELTDRLKLYEHAFLRMSVPAMLFHGVDCSEMNEAAIRLINATGNGSTSFDSHPLVTRLARDIAEHRELEKNCGHMNTIEVENGPALVAEFLPATGQRTLGSTVVLLHSQRANP